MSTTCEQIFGLTSLSRAVLYRNRNAKWRRPDISKEDEVDLLSYSGGAVIIPSTDEPVWRRERLTGNNANEMFIDSIEFKMIGLTDTNDQILKFLRETRDGFLLEVQLNNTRNLIMQAPVFLQNVVNFNLNEGGHVVTLAYRVPTPLNYLTKLNDLVFGYSFYFADSSSILAWSNSDPLIINE